MPRDFEVFESPMPGATVITVRGEVDVATSPQVAAVVAKVLTRHATDIVIDLTEVEFIDSTGLGMLVGAQRSCRSVGTKLGLAVRDQRIMRLLEITGLDSLFPTAPDPHDVVTVMEILDQAPEVYPTSPGAKMNSGDQS